MKQRRIKRILILPALFLALAMISRVEAAPPQQGENLLRNPSFEQPFVNGAADGWNKWSLQTEKTEEGCLDGYHYLPKWNMESGGNFVANGNTSQYIGNNWDTWSAGVQQTVNVTPGVTYRFSFAAKGRATNEPSPDPSDSGVNMNIRAGIDPNGSGQWNDSDVVWGASGSPHDTWQTFTVEATATGDKMTVFTFADFGVVGVNQCRQFMDTWYDNAQLVSAGPPPTNTPPPAPPATQPPAATPTALPSPTPEPEATADTPPTTEPDQPEEEAQPTAESEIAQVSGGTICVNAFHDENGNGQIDDNEGYMAGVTMIVAGQTEVVGQAISDGSATPVCFSSLEPGPYQVAQQPPGRLQMTTSANALVSAVDNQTVNVVFGSRLRQDGAGAPEGGLEAPAITEPGAEAAQEDSAQQGFDPLAMSGLAVLFIGAVLLGVLIFFLLRR